MNKRKAADARLLSTYRSVVQLDAGAAKTEGDKPVWLQIAKTGSWKGHHSGAFEFTAVHFAQLIANFRAHPWYSAGADGIGCADVVPFDFNHASEMNPSEGELPVLGAPAQAWVLDLEVRPGNSDSTLWALTRLLEPAKTYIAEGKIKSTSVAVWINAVDQVTGKKVGPRLTSVAFTNQPFIQGMQPVSIAAREYYGGRADSPEDALTKIRGLFGLSELTSFNDVMSQIKQLQVWVETGTVPFGVDADCFVTALRTILSLPPLSTTAEVFAEADKLLPALIEQQALEAAETAANMPAENADASLSGVAAAAPLTASQHKDSTMNKILLALTPLFCLRADTSEDVVIEAAREQHTQLSSLHKALGVKDAEGAASKVAELLTTAKKHAEVEPELVALRAQVDAIETDAAKKEVAEVIAFHKLPATMEDLLLDARKKDKVGFAKRFPLPNANERHLTQTQFAGADGSQVGSTVTGADRVELGERSGTLQLDNYPGRNRVEKCKAHILATVKGADSWDFDKLHEAACALNRQHPATRA